MDLTLEDKTKYKWTGTGKDEFGTFKVTAITKDWNDGASITIDKVYDNNTIVISLKGKITSQNLTNASKTDLKLVGSWEVSGTDMKDELSLVIKK